MQFDVERKVSYTLKQESIKTFKQKMIERIKEESENEIFDCTIDNISDDIIKEPLHELIQAAFDILAYYQGGVHFDDYFGTVWLDCEEKDVDDCIYEATELWKKTMGV